MTDYNTLNLEDATQEDRVVLNLKAQLEEATGRTITFGDPVGEGGDDEPEDTGTAEPLPPPAARRQAPSDDLVEALVAAQRKVSEATANGDRDGQRAAQAEIDQIQAVQRARRLKLTDHDGFQPMTQDQQAALPGISEIKSRIAQAQAQGDQREVDRLNGLWREHLFSAEDS